MTKKTQTPGFIYVQTKAAYFLTVGPDEFFRENFFEISDEQPSQEEQMELSTVLTSACKQLIKNQGGSIDDPLSDLDIPAFYYLMNMFHFEITGQSIVDETPDHFIDEMKMEHRMIDYMRLTLFNKVRKRYPD